MSFVEHYECTICGTAFPASQNILTCSHCGEKGILDVIYDYKSMKKVVTKDFFKQNNDYSIWRYKDMMSVDYPDLGNTLHVGWTPLYRSNKLELDLGIKKLYIKDEGVNPTASLKDRASVVACIKALEVGAKVISCSSTGNAASSLAGNAARLGLETVIFVPKRAPIGKLSQLLNFGSTVISVDGDYKDTFNLSKEAIDHFGFYNRNAAINPHLVEGKKTVALEIAEQLDFNVTDWVAVSVGDGCTIAGVYKGFYDLLQLEIIDKIPKILGVQSSGCSPFYDAFVNKRDLEETEENTIADSIAVGIPRNPVKGLNAVSKSNGTWITVTDDEILDTMKYLASSEGVFSEPAGATGTAGVIKAVKEQIIKSTDTVTVISTGNGLKDSINAIKSGGSTKLLKPNLEELIKYLDEEVK